MFMRFLKRILQIWTGVVTSRPRLVLGTAFLLAVASVWLTAARLEILTDQLELIGKHHPLIALSDKLDPFESKTRKRFDVVIEAPTPARAISFVNELAPLIARDVSHFQNMFYRVDPEPLKKWQLLYLNEPEIMDLRKKLDEHTAFLNAFANRPEFAGFLKCINQEMSSRMVGELFTGFLDEKSPEGDAEPFDLSPLINTLEGVSSSLHGQAGFKSPWTSLLKGDSWDPDLEGYFWHADKRYLLAFVIPKKSEGEMVQTQDSLAQLREYLQELRFAFPDVKTGVTGQEALDNDQMSTVSEDMSVATWISIAGIFILLVVFRRSFRRPLLQTISLSVGLCWSFGCATLVVGHLNIISVVFAPVLVGMGVDPAIHWFSRLEEEERHGGEMTKVIRTVNERSGPGILLAGLGNTICFLPLILTGFRGLMELGLITAMGIFVCLLSDFSVLTALTVLLGGKPRKEKSLSKDLIRLNPGSARRVLVCAGIMAAFSALAASQVFFDLNPLRLQAANAESVIWEKSLIASSSKSTIFASAFASSPEDLTAKTKVFKALPSVSEVDSVVTLLPEDQDRKLPLLHSLQPKIPSLRPVILENKPSEAAEIIDVLERIRFKMQDDQAKNWGASKPVVEQMIRVRSLALDIMTTLQSSADAMERLSDYSRRFNDDLRSKWDSLEKGARASALRIEDLPDTPKDWFYQQGTYLLRIFPKESVWNEHALSRFVQELQTVDPEVVGDPVTLHVFASAFKDACVKASVYAVIAIMTLLFLTLRDMRLLLLAMVPLWLGSLLAVGIMGVADIQFNLANSIFMPLVVGAGVEYAVVIISRWMEGRMIPGHLPISTGKGVILAALTTTLGFGVLMISRHRGIFSLGFISFAGSLCVLLSAVVIVPAILAITAPHIPQMLSRNARNPRVHGPGIKRLQTPFQAGH